MRKAISSALSTALALQVLWLPHPAYADGISYTPVAGHTGGLLDGTASVGRVANLQLSGATALFQGNAFQVKTGTSTNPALFGVVLDPRLDTSGKKAKYQAVAFVQGGDALPRLATAGSSNETVVLTDNTELDGTINSIDGSKLVITTPQGQRTVELASVTSMSSPRLCDLTLVAQANNTVDPTRPFTADTGSARVSMTPHRGSYPAVRKRSSSSCAPMRRRTSGATTSTYTTTKTTTQTKDIPFTVPGQQASTQQTVTQPAVVEQTMTQPAVATNVCQTVAQNPWAWVIGAALLATAIAVPLAVGIPAHRRHERRERRRREQALASWNQYYYLNSRATP